MKCLIAQIRQTQSYAAYLRQRGNSLYPNELWVILLESFTVFLQSSLSLILNHIPAVKNSTL